MQPTEITAKNSQDALTHVHALVAADFERIQSLFLQELASEVPLVNDVTQHILQAGGKRLRPTIVLLTAKALGLTQQSAELDELAGIIELIHTATLLHDDVVDGSTQRRNRPTANALWGNAASVLAGDFLYSRAFLLLARRSNIPVMQLLAHTTNRISEGEVWQLMNIGNSQLTEDDYLNVIQCKTAELYAACSSVGAMLATQHDATLCAAAKQFGLHLGIAFQMIDDVLDYTGDPQAIGKNLGDDLAEGKVTLPLLYTLQHGDASQQAIIRDAIQQSGSVAIEDVIATVMASGGLDYTRDRATQFATSARSALSHFPVNRYTAALELLCDFVLTRRG